MTVTYRKTTQNSRFAPVFISLAAVFLILYFIKSPQSARDDVQGSLALCVRVLIPSVFPCMVLSGLLVKCGGERVFARLFGKPFSFLFGLSPPSASALILGLFCGFPVAAITASELVRQGRIDKNEASRLMCFANLPSPAFVIGAVGNGMFNDTFTGLVLYFSCVISALIIGFFKRNGTKTEKRQNYHVATNNNFSVAFTKSVTTSAVSMLNICAFVVIFCALSGVVSSVTGLFTLPDFVNPLITGVFEMTKGCADAALYGNAPLACFVLGWSGFCVHFQIYSFGTVRRYAEFTLCMLVRGLVASLISMLVFLMSS